MATKVLILGVLALLPSCDLGSAAGGLMVEAVLPAAHVEVLFDAGTKGAIAENEFHVLRTGLYAFTLNYQYKEGDFQDQARVRKLVEGIDIQSYPIRTLNDGLSIPVRLSISREGEAQSWSIENETSTKQVTEGFGSTEVSRLIMQTVLKPGRYRARVEALQETAELQTVAVRFSTHGRGE